jgi:hypothetical protein
MKYWTILLLFHVGRKGKAFQLNAIVINYIGIYVSSKCLLLALYKQVIEVGQGFRPAIALYI